MSYGPNRETQRAIAEYQNNYTIGQEVVDISHDTGKFVYEHRGQIAGVVLVTLAATGIPESRSLALTHNISPTGSKDIFDSILEAPLLALEIGAVSSLASQVTTEISNVNAHRQAIQQNQIPPEQLGLYIKSMPKRFITKVIATSFSEAAFIYLGTFGMKHIDLSKNTTEQILLTAASVFSIASGVWPNSWKKGLQEVAAESVVAGIR